MDQPAASSRRALGATALALGLVLAVALLLRWPHLQLVPHLTDETGEVLWAYDIAFNGTRPLTHNDAYNGPLWAYILAAVLRLTGPSATLPRWFALGLALPVVALTFALGGQLARRGDRLVAATVAGLFLATHFTHALVNSRVPWSNASTPLWTTLTALALLAAVRRRSGWMLVGTGLLGGLALHTHPSVSVFLAGLVLWFLVDARRRLWLRSPWPWLAAGTVVVAYSPEIVHNLGHGFATLTEAQASRNFATDSGVPWPRGVLGLLGQLGRTLAGGFTPAGPDPAWEPVGWAYTALALAALLWLARQGGDVVGRRLPLTVVLVAVVALPLFNANWQGLLEARYLGFTWPLVYAAAGVAVAESRWRLGPLGRVAGTVALVLLLALPAARLWRHDTTAHAEQLDNQRLWAQLAAIQERPTAGPVLVDEDLKATPWRAGGHPRRAMEYLLTLAGTRYERADGAEIRAHLADGAPAWLLLAGATANDLAAAIALEPVDVTPRPGEGAWGLYFAPGSTPPRQVRATSPPAQTPVP